MNSVSIWTLLLRCYKCGERFTFPRLTMDKVRALPLPAPCPHCGSRPTITAEKSILHRIVDLRGEKGGMYRKPAGGDTWHFIEKCSKWPTQNFVELEMPPQIGELCNECKCKAEKQTSG